MVFQKIENESAKKMMNLLLLLALSEGMAGKLIIGASLSKPHTSQVNSCAVYMYTLMPGFLSGTGYT